MQIEKLANSVLSSTSAVKQTANGNGASFQDVFSEALKNTMETEKAEEQSMLSLLAGEDTDIHTSMIETQKAELALELTLQIRNKIIDSYKEIMQMQV